MSEHEARALRPLWHLVSGAAIGIIGAHLIPRPGPSLSHWVLLALGGTALLFALLAWFPALLWRLRHGVWMW